MTTKLCDLFDAALKVPHDLGHLLEHKLRRLFVERDLKLANSFVARTYEAFLAQKIISDDEIKDSADSEEQGKYQNAKAYCEHFENFKTSYYGLVKLCPRLSDYAIHGLEDLRQDSGRDIDERLFYRDSVDELRNVKNDVLKKNTFGRYFDPPC